LECAFNDERQARDLTTPLLRRAAGDRPSAILAMSDRLALGAVAAAREAGLAEPKDPSVTGFDDVADSTLTELPLRPSDNRMRRRDGRRSGC
jgi:DNA-binding LacI/PurR family transcriptional regulator